MLRSTQKTDKQATAPAKKAAVVDKTSHYMYFSPVVGLPSMGPDGKKKILMEALRPIGSIESIKSIDLDNGIVIFQKWNKKLKMDLKEFDKFLNSTPDKPIKKEFPFKLPCFNPWELKDEKNLCKKITVTCYRNDPERENSSTAKNHSACFQSPAKQNPAKQTPAKPAASEIFVEGSEFRIY